ncbi:MAG: DUF3833 family protein [Yoonia sp.]|nr:DUF3833 family protein [Yoonia sp.]
MRVTCDDWMWPLGEDRVVNRACVKHYGIDIGEVRN